MSCKPAGSHNEGSSGMRVVGIDIHRTGGEQKVLVKHVTVNEGGQAIVGNIEGRGRG
jgi:hypothetical protein